MNVLQYLSLKGIEASTAMYQGGMQAFFNCPFCGEKKLKFMINLTIGYGVCLSKETECGWRGGWYEFQSALGDRPLQLDTNIQFGGHAEKEYEVPEGERTAITFAQIAFFESKGISTQIVERFNVGCSEDDIITFPYYKDYQVVNLAYVSMKDGKRWNESSGAPVLFNRDNIGGHSLIITENEFDVMSFAMCDIEAVSPVDGIGELSWIEHEWEWLERFNKIYFAFGSGVGPAAVQKIAQRLGLWRCYSVKLPAANANQALIDGVLKQKIKWCLDASTGYDMESLVSPEEFQDEILLEYHDPRALYGESTGFPGLDHYIKGWRGGEVTVWSGRNSSGKTTILNQVLIKQVQKSIPACVASMEMPPRRLLRWWIMQMELYTSEENIKKAIRQLKDLLFIADITGTIEPDAIMNLFEYAAKKYGVKHFVVDSLMRISLNPDNELTEQKNFVSRLTTFAMEFNVHVHLVAHPRKGDRDSRRPDKVDVAGTGDITNLADNVLVMFRLDKDQKKRIYEREGKRVDCLLIVKKNREWGDEGNVAFIFDLETRRYSEPPEIDAPPETPSLPYKDD